MELVPGIKAHDLALVVDNTLIVADLHIGYEESLNKRGVLLPRQQTADMAKRLEAILKSIEAPIDTVIINGDLKHEFGVIHAQEWRMILKFFDFLEQYCKKIVVVAGNHDVSLKPIAEKRAIEIVEQYRVNEDTVVMHGDKLPESLDKNTKTIIIGHEHPAVTLAHGLRKETFKAFVFGTWNDKQLIIQPSFNSITAGTDLVHSKPLSPFLKGDISKMQVVIVSDDYSLKEFGTLEQLREI